MEEAGDEVVWEEVAPDQLQEQLLTTPAEGMHNRGQTAPESFIAIIVGPLMSIGHINVQTWTQNNKRSFI